MGNVTLLTVSGIANVKCGFYLRVAVDGSATITLNVIGGKYGKHYNPRSGEVETVKNVSKPSVNVSGKIEATAGFVPAAELHVKIFGKLCSMELFLGAKITLSWSSKHVECIDLDVNGNISLEFKFECDLAKKIKEKTGKKIKGWSFEASAKLLDIEFDLWNPHLEIGKGFVDRCTYDNTFIVDFCTFTNQKVPVQYCSGGDKVNDPSVLSILS